MVQAPKIGKRTALEDSVPLPLKVSRPLYEYLTWLSLNSTLGNRETEVASFILRAAIRQMITEKEHEQTFPRDPRSMERQGGTEENDV